MQNQQIATQIPSFHSNFSIRSEYPPQPRNLSCLLDYLQYLTLIELHPNKKDSYRFKKKKKEVGQEMARAFKSLDLGQLISYYCMLVEVLGLVIQQNKAIQQKIPQVLQQNEIPDVKLDKKESNASRESKQGQKQKYQKYPQFLVGEGYIRSNIHMWTLKKLRLDKSANILYTQLHEKIKIFPLHSYLMRKSHTSTYFCLVLEAITTPSSPSRQTLRIGFEKEEAFQKWWDSVAAAIKEERRIWIRELYQKQATKINSKIQIDHSSLHKRQSIQEVHQNSLQMSSKLEQQLSKESFEDKIVHFQSKNPSFEQKVEQEQSISSHSLNASLLKQSSTQAPQSQQELPIPIFTHLLCQPPSLSLEMMQLKLQQESQDIKQRKFGIEYSDYLQGQPYSDLWEKLEQSKQFQSQSLKSIEISIQKHKDQPKTMKMQVIIADAKLSKQRVAMHLLSHSSFANKQYKSLQVILPFSSQNAVLYLLTLSPATKLIRPRSFLILRHLSLQNGKILISQKSVKGWSEEKREAIVRGYMQANTTIQFIQKDKIKICWRGIVDYGGEVGDIGVKKYLLGMLRGFKQMQINSQNQKCQECLFNLEWEHFSEIIPHFKSQI